MDIGFGIQVMWPLATKEAVAGVAAEVEPGHVLCGALKLAEIPAALLRETLPQELVAAIEEDQCRLCEVLESLGIRVPDDSTPLRRSVRRFLRKGNCARPGNRDGVIHRSAASKELFARAEKAAKEAGEKEVGTGRLVETLLLNPDEVLAGALAKIGNIRIDAGPEAGKAVSSWIDAYGCDLTGQARAEKSDTARLEAIRRDAVCRVLAEVLFDKARVKKQPVLLVSRGERCAAAVTNDLALWLVSASPPSDVRSGCVLEIHSVPILNREAEGSPEARLEEVFQNTATGQSMVLFFDDFHRYLTPAIAGDGLARRFQTILSGTKTACVMGMTQKQYETHVEHAASWRNAFKLIWIHDTSPDFQL